MTHGDRPAPVPVRLFEYAVEQIVAVAGELWPGDGQTGCWFPVGCGRSAVAVAVFGRGMTRPALASHSRCPRDDAGFTLAAACISGVLRRVAGTGVIAVPGWDVSAVAARNGYVPVVSPLVVLSGPTATGKTTAAGALAAATGVDRWTASDRLVAVLAGGTKAERLRSWLAQDTEARRTRNADVDRATDLGLLIDIQRARRPLIVESVALPLLFPPDNPAFIVRLAASLSVRAARLRGLVPDLSDEQARIILGRKDRSTRAALRAAWGVDPEAVRACQWRADLVVQCPDAAGCPNPQQCATVTAELIIAAYRVYRVYVAAGTASVPRAVVDHLTGLISAHRTRVRRCTPLLTDPTSPLSVLRWRRRLLIEFDQAKETSTHDR